MNKLLMKLSIAAIFITSCITMNLHSMDITDYMKKLSEEQKISFFLAGIRGGEHRREKFTEAVQEAKVLYQNQQDREATLWINAAESLFRDLMKCNKVDQPRLEKINQEEWKATESFTNKVKALLLGDTISLDNLLAQDRPTFLEKTFLPVIAAADEKNTGKENTAAYTVLYTRGSMLLTQVLIKYLSYEEINKRGLKLTRWNKKRTKRPRIEPLPVEVEDNSSQQIRPRIVPLEAIQQLTPAFSPQQKEEEVIQRLMSSLSNANKKARLTFALKKAREFCQEKQPNLALLWLQASIDIFKQCMLSQQYDYMRLQTIEKEEGTRLNPLTPDFISKVVTLLFKNNDRFTILSLQNPPSLMQKAFLPIVAAAVKNQEAFYVLHKTESLLKTQLLANYNYDDKQLRQLMGGRVILSQWPKIIEKISAPEVSQQALLDALQSEISLLESYQSETSQQQNTTKEKWTITNLTHNDAPFWRGSDNLGNLLFLEENQPHQPENSPGVFTGWDMLSNQPTTTNRMHVAHSAENSG
jgi:hypothetical protein